MLTCWLQLWKHGLFKIPAETASLLLQILSDTSYTGDKLEEVQYTPTCHTCLRVLTAPFTLQQRGFLKSMLVVERKLRNRGSAKGQLRYCTACDVYKPDRTHHCRICGK